MSATKRQLKQVSLALQIHAAALGALLPKFVANSLQDQGLSQDQADKITLLLWSQLAGATHGTIKKLTGEDGKIGPPAEIVSIGERHCVKVPPI